MRKLKIGVIMDPIGKIDIDKDTTFVLMLEAQRRGHEVFYMELGDLLIRKGTPGGRFRPVRVARANPHYEMGSFQSEALDWFDVLLMRKDPPFEMNYFFATLLLSLVDERKCVVINHPKGLREANEKLYALKFPDLIPETLVTGDVGRLKDFMRELGGEMIIKPLDGCGGSGIFFLSEKDRNTNALLETATDNGRKSIMAQRYIKEIRQGDKRVIVLDGKPIGAVLRVPREDENRGNIHVGGQCIKTDLTDRDLEICRVLSSQLRADGLYFVGLDIIGDYLTEVNVTSPTGVQEINALNQVRLEGPVIDFIERKAREIGT